MSKLGARRHKKNIRRPGQLRDEFRVREVMEILQLPEYKVVNWFRSGHVNKSVSAIIGTGRRKVFSRLDLYQTAVVAKLVDDGFDIRNDWIRLWVYLLFHPRVVKIIDAIEKEEQYAVILCFDPSSGVGFAPDVIRLLKPFPSEAESKKLQEADWLNRQGRDRVFVVSGGREPPSERPRLIDRARGRGKTELRVAIERQLKKSSSVYCLQVDELLNGVDGRIL